jgi:CRP-like cAMP-binding protein
VDAVALVDTMLAAVPAADLFSLIDADPRFARALLASLSQRMQALVSDFEAATLHGAEERLAAYLESLAPPGPQPCTVRLPAAKTVIASRLGMTKETLSRLLHELAQAGLIRVQKAEIALLDRARLRRAAS